MRRDASLEFSNALREKDPARAGQALEKLKASSRQVFD
jgi:hypothetical protein